MKLLIKNAIIIDWNYDVYDKGCIEIKDDKILHVYAGEPRAGIIFDEVIDAKQKVAMPGLVNSHTHSSMTILRNYGADLSLENWLCKKIFPVEDLLTKTDMYYGTLLAGIEMIKSGTTSFADMYLAPDEHCKAVVELGMRANICALPIDQNDKNRSPFIEFQNRWKNETKIKPYVLVHSAYLYGEKEMRISAETAKEADTGIHTHLLETRAEYLEGINRYGINNALEMQKCGMFDVPVIAAHCVHVTEEDISLLAENKVNVAHNPVSNLKLGSGIAPISRMLKKSINVCLGTDGAASNNSLDLFEEIKLSVMLQKGINQDAELLNSTDALRMATINGARAMGFDYVFGEIKAGSKADLILIDIDKPHFTPLNDVIEAIVYCANGSDVDTVIIDGKLLMKNRELLYADEEKVIYEVNKAAKRIIK